MHGISKVFEFLVGLILSGVCIECHLRRCGFLFLIFADATCRKSRAHHFKPMQKLGRMQMIKMNRIIIGSAILLGCVAQAQAAITNVTLVGTSTAAAPAIIAAPSDVLDSCVLSAGQVGFNEAQGVMLPVQIMADDGVIIPAGTVVDSHMIYINMFGGMQEALWTFKKPIIAVMSDHFGVNEAASSALLGAPSTNYSISPSPNIPGCTGAAPYQDRGLDRRVTAGFQHINCPNPFDGDCYTVSDNTLDVEMWNSDYIRVLTQGALKVAIDIKGDERRCIDNHKHGQLRVSIFGNANVDAKQIVTSSLSIAGMSVRAHEDEGEHGKGRREEGRGRDRDEDNTFCKVRDKNNDGYYDLECNFFGDASGLSAESATLELSGKLKNGAPIEGSDTFCVH